MRVCSRAIASVLAIAMTSRVVPAQQRATAATAMHASVPAVTPDSQKPATRATTYIARGAVIGAATGAVAGLVTELALEHYIGTACPVSSRGCGSPTSGRVALTIAGGVAGAILGTATGAFIALIHQPGWQ